MFKEFHLMAIFNRENEVELQGMPLTLDQSRLLRRDWHQQYDSFLSNNKREFSASWKLERDQYFIIPDHTLSEKFTDIDIENFINVEVDSLDMGLIDSIAGIVAYVMDENNKQIMLFQRFIKSQVIKQERLWAPTRARAREPAFEGVKEVLTFGNKLTAVYCIENKTLLVDSIRNAKAFMPSLSNHYDEASDDMIRKTLHHRLIECQDIENIVDIVTPTIRRQFAIIEESGILNQFSAMYIREKAAEGNVKICVHNDKIVFPTADKSIKAVLVCLCDGLVRSILTGALFETNSKKKVDE